ncbi:flagellar biosynthetic protein FliR [Pedococcus sp. KACC 23699]|uniref:Flagellar biosynthetic protein FliR n=1 Tax=Pedococcus sp. KACC 23699 TaxID=3149228 RepID=A0AAU7JYU4_9MICO
MRASLSAETLVVLLLATVRMSAFFAIAPPFSSRSVPARVKAGMAFALALCLLPTLSSTGPTLDLPGIAGATLWQVAVGMVMGFVVHVAVSVIQAAGELLDLASGFTLASLYDPLSNVSSSMFGRIQQLLAITLLFAANGHLVLVRGLMMTFRTVPLRPLSIGDLSRLATEDLGRFLAGALQIAAPVLVVLFLAELALGLVSRAVPTLNIFAMSFPVKIILAISLAGVAFALLPGAVSRLLDQATHDMVSVAAMMGTRS